MAAAWAVVQPFVGVFVGGSTGADYLGCICLRWPARLVVQAVSYVDEVSSDYADIWIP